MTKYHGIQVIDFRNQQLLSNFEKSQDVMSMVVNNENLYLGVRSHSIRHSILRTEPSTDSPEIETLKIENQGSLDPPHYDILTNLCLIKKSKLVSASKDKIIKLWDLPSNPNTKPKLITQIDKPHQTSHISCLLGNQYENNV
jgi:WD40 repeat protein